MKASHGNRVVDVWRINHALIKEGWVKAAFEKNIWWHTVDNDIILLNASWSVASGKADDFVIKDERNLTLVDKHQFKKDYIVLNYH